MKFSIVVPVYNLENCLDRCIASIIPAITDDDEIILSLGESADNSTAISYHLAEKYPSIRIVHQTGCGLSNARNCANQVVTGDYIIYIDGDDFVDTNEFASLLQQMRADNTAADVVIHDFYRHDKRLGKIIPVFQIGDIPPQADLDFLPKLLHTRQCFWNVWRFIFRREFLLNNSIEFKENTLSEDIDYVTSVFLAQPSVLFMHCPFYVYIVGAGNSLMDRPTAKRISDTADVLRNSIARLRMSNLLYAQTMIARFQFEYILNIMRISDVRREDRTLVWDAYSDWRTVLADSQDPAVSMTALFLHILGLKTTSHFLHVMKHLYYRFRKTTRLLSPGHRE